MINRIIIFILISISLSSATDNKLKAMGNISFALPDIEAQINLFQLAGNNAWLKMNDSLNWTRAGVNSFNENGGNRRLWDSRKLEYNFISYEGQKHLAENITLFGEIQYIWDNRYGANQAIEKEPYALDPFVLTDSTSGSFLYSGPRVNVVFNQKITESLYWGAALQYFINKGLKNIYTRPEIINREIYLSIDLVYRINPLYSIGISFKPYNIRDHTKLVNQPDKTQPITFRYRGEYEFRKHVGVGDREAEYEGFELLFPQFAWNADRWEGVVYTGYYYRRHELFDNPIKKSYEGFYQGRHYFCRLTSRCYFGWKKETALVIDYQYRYIEDWATEPRHSLMIYQSFHKRHDLLAGVSHRFGRIIEVAAEGYYKRQDPDRRDYLAQVYRRGDIESYGIKSGINYNLSRTLSMRMGFEYNWYRESKVWNYYGDNEGPVLSIGAGYYWNKFELDGYFRYGKRNRDETYLFNGQARYREELHISVQLKTLF